MNRFCCLRNGQSHQNLFNGVSTSPAALAKLSSSRGVTTAVGESYATDSEERTLDIVLGDDIANQQYKVLFTFSFVRLKLFPDERHNILFTVAAAEGDRGKSGVKFVVG